LNHTLPLNPADIKLNSFPAHSKLLADAYIATLGLELILDHVRSVVYATVPKLDHSLTSPAPLVLIYTLPKSVDYAGVPINI
jgi:hypothetical protein